MPALPTGTIALWFGSVASIPPGFTICDGTGGTPDLRDRFIVGAGSTYPVDATGGSVNHSHPFTGDGHSHDIGAGFDLASGATWQALAQTKVVTGTTNNSNHLPPYHALIFIMKT